MKVPVTFQPSLGEWFDLWGSGPLQRDRLKYLIVNELLCESQEDYKKQVSQSSSSSTKSHLIDLKKYVSWSVKAKPQVSVTLVANSLDEQVEEQLTRINQELRESRREIAPSEHRDKTFDRKFRILCEKATRIEIFDQYASKSIGLREQGSIWLLDKVLDSNQNSTISIYCLDINDSVSLGISLPERIAKVRKSLTEIVLRHHDFNGEVRVNIGPSSMKMHDRRFSFRFDSGVTSLNVGRGLGMFNSEYSQDYHTVDLSDSSSLDTIRKIIDSFTTQKQNVTEIVIRHSEVCKPCSVDN